MASSRELSLILNLKDNASAGLKNFDSRMKDMQPTFRKMAAVGTAAFAGITAAVYKSVQAYQDQERAESRLLQIATQVTGATQEQIDGYIELANQLQRVGVVGDDVVVAGQSQLASFTKNHEVVSLLSGDLADLAVAQYGVNVSQEQAIQTANLMGKALTGQLGALTRTGILVSDEYRVAFEEANDEHERAIILSQIIADNYGGLNEAMRETTEGGIQAMKNAFGDLQEAIGKAFIPALTELVEKITPLIEKFAQWAEENPQLVKQITIAAAVFAALVAVLGFLGMIIIPLKAGIMAVGVVLGAILSPIGLVIAAIIAIIAVVVYWIKNWEDIKETLVWTWEIIKEAFQKGVDFIKDVFKGVVNFLITMIENWVNSFIKGINTVINAINRVSALAKRVGISVPTIRTIQEISLPKLHNGGMINLPANKEMPIMARGQEAIVPLDRGGFGNTTINVSGSVITERQLIDLVKRGIMGEVKMYNRL